MISPQLLPIVNIFFVLVESIWFSMDKQMNVNASQFTIERMMEFCVLFRGKCIQSVEIRIGHLHSSVDILHCASDQ